MEYIDFSKISFQMETLQYPHHPCLQQKDHLVLFVFFVLHNTNMEHIDQM